MEFVWVSASFPLLKELRHSLPMLKSFQVLLFLLSFPSLIVLDPLWFIDAFLVFFSLVKYYSQVSFNFKARLHVGKIIPKNVTELPKELCHG